MKVLNEWAVTSSVLILIVLAVRFLCRDRLSARLKYALWGVVLLRLLVPFQFELPAPVSDAVPLLVSNAIPAVERWEEPSIPVFPQEDFAAFGFDRTDLSHLEPGDVIPTDTSIGYWQKSQDGETITRYLDLWSPAQIAQAVWRTGGVLMALVLAASNLHFAFRLRRRRKRLENADAPIPVYVAEGLPSPCLFGVLRPAVYLTPQTAETPDTLRHVLAHELTHYAHKDHIWSFLRCLALALHWYNPLVWLSAALSKQDGELACDEGAVARLGEEERIPYGRTLVDMVAARSLRPGDLLSCSTAMNGGGKSIQQRVAQIVRKPETAKTALFTAIAVLALAAVFVFARRADNGKPGDYQTFRFDITSAQSIHLGPEMTSSYADPTVITDPELLEQAKDILSHEASDWLSSPSVLEKEELNLDSLCTLTLTVRGGQKVRYQLARLALADQGPLLESHFCVFTEGSLSSIHGNRIAALLDQEAVPKIYALMRQQRQKNGSDSPELEQFRAEVEGAVSIRYAPPTISSTFYPDPITDPELLTLAKERLSAFDVLEPGASEPDLRKALTSSSRISLSDGVNEAGYSLLMWDGYTYLYSENLLDQLLELDEVNSKTPEATGIHPILRTRNKVNVEGSLSSYARMQTQRLQDPNAPVPMTYAELSKHTPEGIWEARGYRLKGWDGDLRDAKFHIGYTSPEHICLWYYGDETHTGAWVLELLHPLLSSNSSGYTVVSDQPMEVYNAGQQGAGYPPYEQLAPGAFAAFLRLEDVSGAYISYRDMLTAAPRTEPDLETIKAQAVQGLYHQFSDEYDEEMYGQYCLTIQVEKDVGYYLEDAGADGLTLSIGSEPDAVCLRRRSLSTPQDEMRQYIRSPELYRTIQSLCGLLPGQASVFPPVSYYYDQYHAQLQAAQDIHILTTALYGGRTFTDPEQLGQIRKLLALEPLPEPEEPQAWTGYWDQIITFASASPDTNRTGSADPCYYVSHGRDGQSYILLPTGGSGLASGIYLGRIPEENWKAVDRQLYTKQDVSAFRGVMLGQEPFQLVGESGSTRLANIGSVPALFSPSDSSAGLGEFAVVDLDGDGAREVVVHTAGAASDLTGYLVLRQKDGQIYGYPSGWRIFWNLKTDGTFDYSLSDGSEEGTVSLRFTEGGQQYFGIQLLSMGPGSGADFDTFLVNGKNVSEDEYRKAVQKQHDKPDADWYDFTEIHLKGMFP